MEAYDRKIGLHYHKGTKDKAAPFGVASYFEDEISFKGSTRRYWYRQYHLASIGDNFKIPLHEWMKQPIPVANEQIESIGPLNEERSKLLEEIHKDNELDT